MKLLSSFKKHHSHFIPFFTPKLLALDLSLEKKSAVAILDEVLLRSNFLIIVLHIYLTEN